MHFDNVPLLLGCWPTTNDNGTHIGGIVGFLKSIGYTINMFRPTRCIIIWDGKGGSSRRRKMYPEYKAKRKTNIRLNRAYDFETIEEERANMIRQIQRTIEYLDFLPITMLPRQLACFPPSRAGVGWFEVLASRKKVG